MIPFQVLQTRFGISVFILGGRQIANFVRFHVDRINLEILVAIHVFRIQNVLARVGPGSRTDSTMLISRQWPRGVDVIDRGNPNIQYAVTRSNECDLFAVRAQIGRHPVWIVKEYGARDEWNIGLIVG